MSTFDPVVDYTPPPKHFEDKDDEKRKRNTAKERRVAIALIVLTFIASVCILFGTLFPELSRGEVDMTNYRDLILPQNTVVNNRHLIRDRITIVNLGLWRYCYDDQLYDLIEIISPGYKNSLGRKRRDVEKRQVNNVPREGDISIRCHPVPDPWKMPYHVYQKQEATKVCLIIGIVACIISFLMSILVLITRLPLLKVLNLLSCFLAAIGICVALGLLITLRRDAEEYFNEQTGRVAVAALKAEYGFDLNAMGIDLKKANLIEMNLGVSAVFVGAAGFIAIVTVFLAEINRQMINM